MPLPQSTSSVKPTSREDLNYYPFGLTHDQSSGRVLENKYLFNGRELHDSFGLNLYDYKRRFYDPAIGRFTGVDGIADQFAYLSTYQFAALNPIRYVDLDGLEPAYYDFTTNRVVAAGDQTGNFAPADAAFVGGGIDPDSYSTFAEIATELLIGLTPIDEINTFVTGQTADGREAGFKDYVDAGIEVVLIGRKGTGKQGGAYKDLDINTGLQERHHMPSNAASPLSKEKGPSVVMDKADHRRTKSWGNSKEAQKYRTEQKDLIKQGKFKEAQQMDVDDVRSKFGSKYDQGIEQMRDYTNKEDF